MDLSEAGEEGAPSDVQSLHCCVDVGPSRPLLDRRPTPRTPRIEGLEVRLPAGESKKQGDEEGVVASTRAVEQTVSLAEGGGVDDWESRNPLAEECLDDQVELRENQSAESKR